jgi:prepilin-type N-terminal cleavage/methylation domain-containing protein
MGVGKRINFSYTERYKPMKKKGYTLIELLVVMGITAILLDVIYSLYLNSNKSYQLTYAKTGLQTQTQKTLEKLKEDIKKTNRILANYETYTSSANSIILQIPKLDSESNPIENEYDFIVYQTNDNQLQRIQINESIAETKIANSHLQSIDFKYLNDLGYETNHWVEIGQVKVNLVCADMVNKQNIKFSLTSATTLRNR